jgi:hypothetical protein
MDPNETLMVMLEHMAEGDRDGALDALDVLRDWMMGGGFMPERVAEEMVEAHALDRVRRLTTRLREQMDGVDAGKVH